VRSFSGRAAATGAGSGIGRALALTLAKRSATSPCATCTSRTSKRPSGRRKFERLFITGSDEAAGVVLRAVERNERRVLVGTPATWTRWLACCPQPTSAW
jgi:short-subunit dehydrogenase